MAQKKRATAATTRAVLKKRYTLPPKIKGLSCRVVVMRELNGYDEIEAAVWADKATGSAVKDSIIGSITQAEREAIRLSLCEVDGVPVNVDGVPFAGLDRFNLKTLRCLKDYFADLNGVASDAVKESVSAGEVVDGAEETDETDDPAEAVAPAETAPAAA